MVLRVPGHPVLRHSDHQLEVLGLEELVVLEVVLECGTDCLDGLGARLPLGGKKVREIRLY